MNFRNGILVAALSMAVVSCAPVLSRDLMREGTREFNPAYLTETPEAFKGHLFILGGVIVDTKLTEEGSQIEALFVPVDSRGYLEESARYQGRFLALYPRSKGILDPAIYKQGRTITVAGDFLEARKGKIGDLSYTFPVFEIKQLYLWEDYRNYSYGWPYYYPYYPYYYPYYYSSPFLYDPWGRMYPNPYWPPPPW